VGGALLDGRPALLGSPGAAVVEEAVGMGAAVHPQPVDALAALVRPDGYVWWATDGADAELPGLGARFDQPASAQSTNSPPAASASSGPNSAPG
jgi:hypothetical protein